MMSYAASRRSLSYICPQCIKRTRVSSGGTSFSALRSTNTPGLFSTSAALAANIRRTGPKDNSPPIATKNKRFVDTKFRKRQPFNRERNGQNDEDIEEEGEEPELDRKLFRETLTMYRKKDKPIPMKRDEYGKVLDIGLLTEWRKAPLRPAVKAAIKEKYPELQFMTETQKEMLHHLNVGHSVFMNAEPASGKSFALTAWMLSLDRAVKFGTQQIGGQEVSTTERKTTALVLVESMEQAQMYQTWVWQLINTGQIKTSESTLAPIIQSMYRAKAEEERQVQLLKNHPNPHILVATPTRLLEVLADTELHPLIDLDYIQVIAVDTKVTLDEIQKKARTGYLRPREQVIDYIINRRHMNILKNRALGQEKDESSNMRPGIQLVFDSFVHPERVENLIRMERPHWLEKNESKSLDPSLDLKGESIQDYVQCGVIRRDVNAGFVRYVTKGMSSFNDEIPVNRKNVKHYMVTYDLDSTILKSVTVGQDWDEKELAKRHYQYYKVDHQSKDRGRIAKENAVALMNYEDGEKGYPVHMVGPVIETLLENDGYPSNPFIFVDHRGSLPAYREFFLSRGYDARVWNPQEWNRLDKNKRLPVGHSNRIRQNPPTGGKKEEMIVWLVKRHTVSGIDIPGITHGYVAFKPLRPHYYYSMTSVLARDPSPAPYEKDEKPLEGRLTSIYFVDHLLPGERKKEKLPYHFPNNMGVRDMNGCKVILAGSRYEKETWEREAFMRKRVGELRDYLKDKPMYKLIETPLDEAVARLENAGVLPPDPEPEPKTVRPEAETEPVLVPPKATQQPKTPDAPQVVVEADPAEKPVQEHASSTIAETVSEAESTAPSATESLSQAAAETEGQTSHESSTKEIINEGNLSEAEIEEFRQAQKEIEEGWAELGLLMKQVGERSGIFADEGEKYEEKDLEDTDEVVVDFGEEKKADDTLQHEVMVDDGTTKVDPGRLLEENLDAGRLQEEAAGVDAAVPEEKVERKVEEEEVDPGSLPDEVLDLDELLGEREPEKK